MFDSGLLNLLNSNPQKAMPLIMDQYSSFIYSIVKGRVGNVCSEEDIEEIVCDVFISFYNNRENIDLSKGTLSAYFARLARNKAIDKFRSSIKSNETSIDSDEMYLEIADSFNLQDSVEKTSLQNKLINEIINLGDPDKSIIYRKYFLFQSSKEIGNALNLSCDNVRKRLSRALRKLENNLKGEYYEI